MAEKKRLSKTKERLQKAAEEDRKRFDIVGRRKIWYALSLLIIIPGIICMFTKGFNFSIDFTGGTIIEMRFDQPVGIGDVRDVLKGYGLDNSQIQLSGETSSATTAKDVMVRTGDLEEHERKAVMASLKEKLGNYTMLREEKVGAVIGDELVWNAIYATVISWFFIVIYVSVRFEWRFGVAAVFALVHDILVLLSVFSFLGKQVDSSFVAALMTIVGYSINDTIVIFDRIRENLRLYSRRGGEVEGIANRSIYQTLTRSLYTVVTCLFTTLALQFFGGETTKDFAFALNVGFLAGSYSSIFIASPLWVTLRNYSGNVSGYKKEVKEVEEKEEREKTDEEKFYGD